MRPSLIVSLSLAIICAAAFWGTTLIGVGEDLERILGFVLLPGFIGILIAVFLASIVVGNPHGGGDPAVIAALSVLFNTALFRGAIQLVTIVMNGIRKRAKE